ncbi:hypothetical protein AVEN_149471-1 [Araneus ventricosus]|uniref:Uncharacterized protein n=1 Tax=Araneus ventricosus TaxID=182803 RepID=A0A4Y2N1Y9_ARAVE|nr:hypothetical protein AVEN_149471-1 [Araneus ventricosus]
MSVRSSRTKTRTVQIPELRSQEKVKQKLLNDDVPSGFERFFSQLHNWSHRTQLLRKTAPKIQHWHTILRPESDREMIERSENNFLYSPTPQLKSSHFYFLAYEVYKEKVL